ncbi:MAG: PD40 domain-containing protein [Anaerolineae bacterium]|nr:PD40 domain-containing protein [Anaerolineae bacterium]
MKREINLFIVLLIGMMGLLAACGSAETPAPTVAPPPTSAPTPTDAPPAEPPAPAAPALSGHIVFPVYDETAGTYNIFMAKADGSDRQMVVAAASQPDLNSDGSRIIYRSWQGDRRGLMERGVEGGEPWIFNAHFEAGRPKFAPDNMSFLFHSQEAGEKPAIYRTSGPEYDVLRRESNPIQGEAPAWTPDGQSFVYKTCLATDCGLFFSHIDGGNLRQLTKELSDTNPAVSPNGQSVVYMSQGSGNWDVYVINLEGSNMTQLTTASGNDGLPTWSPDGRAIAFVSDRGGEWAIWAMNPDGGNQRQLFALGGSIDGAVQLDVANSWGWRGESIDWAP